MGNIWNLGIGVVDRDCRPWTIGIAHGLCVPHQAHHILIHLGRRQCRQLSLINLALDVSTLNGLAIDLQTLALSKE